MDLKHLHILQESSAECLRYRRQHYWSFIVSVFENTPKNLVVQARAQLEHSSLTVKVSVKSTYLHFNPWRILEEITKPVDPCGTMPQESWHPGKGAKPVTLSNFTEGKCGPMQVINKQNWENFNNRGTKMLLLSDKLWLIANNPKSFVNRSKSIKNFMVPFYGWGSTASKLEPLWGGSLLFPNKFPEIPGTHFINLERMKGWVDLGATEWFWPWDSWIANPAL